MLLADMGADVVRIDRTYKPDLGSPGERKFDLVNRNKRSIAIDLQKPSGVELALELIDRCDVLVEGFRPGVMERLGLGPDICSARNARIVYGRMTGYGREGPMANVVGHDINYLAISGALSLIGSADRSAVPLNMVADFGGGALFLAMGIVAALFERNHSGRGQVVDAAMIDGVSTLMMSFYTAWANQNWTFARQSNLLDGGAPFYGVYRTLDNAQVSVGAVEERFYRVLLERTGIDRASTRPQFDRSGWPQLRKRLEQIFSTKTRDQWCAIFEGAEACFAPVLESEEARTHPQFLQRRVLLETDGKLQPAPSPRFCRTPSSVRRPPPASGQHTIDILTELGRTADQILALRDAGVVTDGAGAAS